MIDTQTKDTMATNTQIPLPTLEIEVQSFIPPAIETTTIIVENSNSGKQKSEDKKIIPFNAQLIIKLTKFVSENYKGLGATEEPISDIKVILYKEPKDDKIKVQMSYKYIGVDRLETTEQFNHHWEPERQSGPYGPTVPAHMSYETRKISYDAQTEKDHFQNIIMSPELFNQIYMGLVNNTDKFRNMPLIEYLHNKHKKECQTAQDWIKDQLQELAIEAKRKAELAANALEQIKFPKI